MTDAQTMSTQARPDAVLAAVLTGYLMLVIDLSIVYTGLPEIGETLHIGPVMLSWVQNAYLLCFGGFLLLGARLGDLFGRKRMFQWGIVLFTLSSLVIGASQSAVELVAARAVQGIGAAIIAPSVLALISTTFPEGGPRTRALAWYSVVAGAGASLGMVLGGVFAGLLSWRVGFLVNVPIGIGLWFAIGRIIAETDRHSGAFDVTGALTSTLGMSALVFGIVRSAETGWGESVTIGSLVAAVVILACFLLHERHRATAPLLPLRLFASAERCAALAARMLFVGSIVAFFFFTTQLMQSVLGYSPLQAGIAFMPMTIPTFVVAVLVPRLTRRYGNALLLCGALALIAIGMFWLSWAGAEAQYWSDIALPMIVIGIGNGGGLAPLTTAGVRGVENRDQGAAAGLVNVAHQLGGSLGLAVLVVVFATTAGNAPTASEMLVHQLSEANAGAGLMNVAGFVLAALFIWPVERRRRNTLQP